MKVSRGPGGRTRILALLVSAGLLLAACGALSTGGSIRAGSAPYVRGSGHVVTASRTVEPFHAVSAAQGIAVVLSRGAPSLRVTADDNLLGQVTTTLDGGVLHVDIDGGVETDSPLTVSVVTPTPVDRLAASTGARIEADGLDADALAVEVSTGGRVRAAGRASSLRVDAQAGGSAELRDLATRDAFVSLGSGSTASVNATGDVTGALTAGSVLRVSGGGGTSGVSVDLSSSLVRE